MGMREIRRAALIEDVSESAAQDPVQPEVGLYDCEGVPSSVSTFLDGHSSVASPTFFARLFGRSPVPRSLRALYRAARDDIAVIDALTQLGPEWMVRTCSPVGGTGVEHIVIGPAGIFCMIARHQPGGAMWIDGAVLLADGERRPHLRDAEFSAVRLTQTMSDVVGSRVDVTPCLVLLGTRSVTVAKPPKRIAVLTPRDVRTWLKEIPAVFSHDELKALQTSAAAYPDWHVAGGQGSASTTTLEAFRKTQTQMAQARHVRLTWVTGVLVLAWLIAVVSIGGVTTHFFSG